MWKRFKRWLYVRAMFAAVREAMKKPALFSNKGVTFSDGLRVLKRFEEVNGTKFDPYDITHTDIIRGNATHEHFIRTCHNLLPEDD